MRAYHRQPAYYCVKCGYELHLASRTMFGERRMLLFHAQKATCPDAEKYYYLPSIELMAAPSEEITE